jgi:hypothetical protein
MEHRWSMRKSVASSVMVKSNSIGVIQGRVRDISLGGIYVDTGKKPLDLNSSVDLAFVESTEPAKRVCVVPAVVVRTTNEGAGLMFHRFAPSTFRMLQTLLLNE